MSVGERESETIKFRHAARIATDRVVSNRGVAWRGAVTTNYSTRLSTSAAAAAAAAAASDVSRLARVCARIQMSINHAPRIPLSC